MQACIPFKYPRIYDSSTLTAERELCFRDASRWKRQIWSREEWTIAYGAYRGYR